MAKLFKEHRKYLRFPVSIPVHMDNRKDRLSTICSNISQKGIYIETSGRIKKGDLICMNLNLNPAGEPVKVLGEVMWTAKTHATDYSDKPVKGFGVKFLANMKDSLRINDGILQKERWKPSPDKDLVEFSSAWLDKIVL